MSFLKFGLLWSSWQIDPADTTSFSSEFIQIPEWEKVVKFLPLDDLRSKEEWVTLRQGTPQYLTHHVRAEEVINADKSHDINSFPLRNPDAFISGGLHRHVDEWENKYSSDERDKEVLSYIENGVDVTSCFKHFKGNFKGKSYDSDIPPKQYFPNSNSCQHFTSFIKDELLGRIKNGSMRVWARLENVTCRK